MGNCLKSKSDDSEPKTKLKRLAKSTQHVSALKKQYQIDKNVLGAGSFGKVFLGTNLKDKSMKVAIKVMDKSKMDQDELDSIQSEIQLMSTVDHPNICTYYETYDDKKYIYLVMELCTGGEILKAIAEDPKKQNEPYISLQFYKLLRALEHCHSQNIIHRDIKPENIMFGADNEVRFVDFGFALVVNDKRQESEVAGTPYYIAPEVLDEKYNKQCDIWSLGVSLYQLLDGTMPFDGRTPSEVFKKIKSGKFEMPENLTKDCQDLISKMLIVNPKKRITVKDALQHPWIKQSEHAHEHDHSKCDQFPVDTIKNLQNFKGKSLLKKAAMNILVKHLDHKQILDLKQTFEKLDEDNSGYLEYKELSEAIQKSNIDLSPEEIDKLIKEIDYADNSKINYSEFIAATIDVKKFLTTDKLEAIFRSFDVDGSGKITKQNIKDAFSKYGREVSDEEINDMMKKHDLDGQQAITLEEFKIMMTADD